MEIFRITFVHFQIKKFVKKNRILRAENASIICDLLYLRERVRNKKHWNSLAKMQTEMGSTPRNIAEGKNMNEKRHSAAVEGLFCISNISYMPIAILHI